MASTPRPSRGRLWLAMLAVAVVTGLGACRTETNLPGAPTASKQSATQTDALATLPLAPTVTHVRDGVWQGGPEPVSGKLRVGISTYFRQRPALPRAGESFEVDLRFEEVSSNDAQVQLQPSDGANLAVMGAQSAWRLGKDQDSQITVKMKAPPGQSYLHAMLKVEGRQVARSFLMQTQPGKP